MGQSETNPISQTTPPAIKEAKRNETPKVAHSESQTAKTHEASKIQMRKSAPRTGGLPPGGRRHRKKTISRKENGDKRMLVAHFERTENRLLAQTEAERRNSAER